MSRPHPTPTTVLAALALAACLTALPGCLVSSNKHTSVSGRYVGETTFEQIQPGSTSADFVRGALGEPTAKTALADGSELWKYAYTKRTTSQGSVLFLFGGSSEDEVHAAAFVQLKDGVVTKAWRE